jgi:hypothetical protein
MKRQVLGSWALLAALFLVCPLPGVAVPKTASLRSDMVVNRTYLPAGVYLVTWNTHSPRATVQFINKHSVVVCHGRVEKRDETYHENTIVYNTAADGTRHLVEIRFAFSHKVLVFGS